VGARLYHRIGRVGLGEVTVFFPPAWGAIFHGENILSVSRRPAHAMACARRMRDRDGAWCIQQSLTIMALLEEAEERGCLGAGSTSRLDDLVAQMGAYRPDISEDELCAELIN
jgi:hypothetical protein